MKGTWAFRALFVSIGVTTVIMFTHCGKDSGSSAAVSVSSLSQIPSVSAMLKSNGTNGIYRPKNSLLPKVDAFTGLQTVSGTAPLMVDITNALAKTYFWKNTTGIVSGTANLIDLVNGGSWSGLSNGNKQTVRTAFFGGDTTTPGPGGQGACQMAQSTGEAISRMLEAGGTMCYMKGMSSAASGVTVTGATQATAFTQGAADKTVKVDVTNFSESGRPSGTFGVFFTIKGTNTVGAGVYAFDMYMCQGSTVDSKESYSINSNTGVMTASMSDSRSDGGRGVSTGNTTVTAYLKTGSDGNPTIDTSKDRNAVVKYKGTFGKYAGKINISPKDIITGYRYFSGTWGSNYDYSKAGFTGSGLDSMRFLFAAYKGKSVPTSGGQTWSYDGATEWRDTYYVASTTATGADGTDYKAGMSSFDFSTDEYFQTVSTDPTFDSTGLDCSRTNDITITMDFSNTAVKAVKDNCENGKMRNGYEWCWNTDVQTAQTNLFSVR